MRRFLYVFNNGVKYIFPPTTQFIVDFFHTIKTYKNCIRTEASMGNVPLV
jgi:hypothetical protein